MIPIQGGQSGTVSGNPFNGFTLFGGIIVAFLLIAFVRNRTVTAFLGLLLAAYLLINVKKIVPLVFNSNISSSVLKNIP